MQISNFNTVEELNNAGAEFMVRHLSGKKHSLLCAATGSSVTGIYETFVKRKAKVDTASLKIIKLDEWAALPMDHAGTCEYYIKQHLLQPLSITESHYISFNSQAVDTDAECKRIAAELKANGPIDLCMLGIGLNGHIAFNEPANQLQPGVHLSKLSAASMLHLMVKDVAEKPQYGYTLGMADILQAKTILLVVQGKHKKEIFEQWLTGKISTQLPASFLWLHNNAYCYYCEN